MPLIERQKGTVLLQDSEGRSVDEPVAAAHGGDYYTRPREDICNLLQQKLRADSVKTLDVGCATGRLGAELRARGIAGEVHGIEFDEAAANEAATRLDRVWTADVQKLDWRTIDDDYDLITTADVLEHLADPWATLAEMRQVLKPDGHLVASLPNIRHWCVIRDLVLFGDFRYVDAGILDRTHLRFFTRRSIHRLLEESGYQVLYLSGARRPTALLKRLVTWTMRDFAYKQFLVIAVPQRDPRLR